MLLALAITVTWKEAWSWNTIAPRLTLSRGITKTGGWLKLELASPLETAVLEQRCNDPYSEWKLAVPIAVRGSQRPQVLAKLYRRNWLDFVIFSIDQSDPPAIRQSFSFSCRDEQAIRWKIVNQKLVSFETFDRFGTPPRLLDRERKGYRWQLHRTYRYEPSSNAWKSDKGIYEQFRFGDSPPGQTIETAKDCNFRFKG